MPKVGKKQFPYTSEGFAAARKAKAAKKATPAKRKRRK